MVLSKALSIIIPTYNMEKYLPKCLDSLIVSDESMKLLEVLIINDGSKDSSSQIAHEYEIKYPQTFKVIDKENGNYGSCINKGLKEAVGKYIKILDADDYFDTEQFEQYIVKLLDTDTDLVLTDFDIVDEYGTKKQHFSYSLRTKQILMGAELWNNKSFQKVQMHSITYRTEIFSRIDYYQSEGISYTDQEWIFTPMSAVESCIYYPISVYQYLYGRQGQTMEIGVQIKNISHTIQGVCKMCKDYNWMDKTEGKKAYYDYVLYERCKLIYKSYLITHTTLNIKDLIMFDNFLKYNCLDVYNLTDCIIFNAFPIQYVKKWRTNKFCMDNLYFNTIRFIYKVSLTVLRRK